MYLFKMEVDSSEGALTVILAAENEEQAFEEMDQHVERHFLYPPELKEVAIVEKKRITAGVAYVIETRKD
ncbi:DUF3906 family protein [Paenibacillus polymyxa]|jgi:hypothetical protein|uniref:DUF3906 domain-containing protein n=1 Tax=Paenibacillus polymyxa TaxID=1406 RepID=A0A378XW87_PAEPO|nr:MULTISPECIES: DUF3906 family protein [Paenibacillus]MDP9676756.1 hypothetical protein [Paenibacillus jamilae]AHM65428.1 hypothetical protein PPSQR21_017790 [Paenibacillus polymyxa SQR-21]KAF6582636.1 DUF3906 family protein [Paenibacillus sp. EKM211P]KAF6619049.1 DUF3906 family protein [Paenibacillus sp. EKM101P]KAF6624141.1 DUF3906 family protein [Paenibacillus sp. EKM102P]